MVSLTDTGPRVTIYPGRNPQAAWIYFPPFAQHERISAALNFNGTIVEADSMFGPVVSELGDKLILVGHSNHRLADWAPVFAELLAELEGFTGPVYVVGLSRGGQLANALVRWYHQDIGPGRRTLSSLDAVLISTPPTYHELATPQKQATYLLRGYQGGPVFDWSLRHFLWQGFIPPAARRHLRRQGQWWLWPRIREGLRQSTWMPATLSELAHYPGFGPATELPGHVVIANLPGGRDKTINVGKSMVAAHTAYTGPRVHFRELGARFHGLPEIEAVTAIILAQH